jgi:hypothetical protein
MNIKYNIEKIKDNCYNYLLIQYIKENLQKISKKINKHYLSNKYKLF